jgi:hypothetical protein
LGPRVPVGPRSEHLVDRPDVEAPRGVEQTGTNGRKAITLPDVRRVRGASSAKCIRQHGALDDHNSIHIASFTRPLSGSRAATSRNPVGCVQYKICGGHSPGETPGPIPNPEAKAWHGDGTAPDRVWESSSPPHHTSQGGPQGLPFFIPGHGPRSLEARNVC